MRTIPQFHDTRKRFRDFEDAQRKDVKNRARLCRQEIDFVLSRKDDCGVLMNQLEEGKLPLRVTHNDTKLNNILFDKDTDKGLCIIDLDTIMPGLAANDFGDLSVSELLQQRKMSRIWIRSISIFPFTIFM